MEIGQKLDFMHSNTNQITEALRDTSKLIDARNVKFSKYQHSRMLKLLNEDIVFLKSIKSSAYDIYCIAEMKTGTLVLDNEIKDILLFDHSIGDKLFLYRKKDCIIIQEITPAYAMEFHIRNENDLLHISQNKILESRPRFLTRDSRKLTKESIGNSNIDHKNFIICFDSIKESKMRRQSRDLKFENEMPNPEHLLISDTCPECETNVNHIKVCKFSLDVDEEAIGLNGGLLNQIMFSWNNNITDIWMVKLRYRIINFSRVFFMGLIEIEKFGLPREIWSKIC